MLINRDYQVWQCCASDDTRPTLNFVNVTFDQEPDQAAIDQAIDERSKGMPMDDFLPGTAAATNGFILAVVPVTLAADDRIGLIRPEIFKAALAATKKNKLQAMINPGMIMIDLTRSDLAGLVDGSFLPRNDHDLQTFPDWSAVVPARPMPSDRKDQNQLMASILQPGNLIKVVNAIGCQAALTGRGSGNGDGLARMVFGRANAKGTTYDPVIVEPLKQPIGNHFEPPYGLVMPCEDSTKDPQNKWVQK